MYTSMNIDYAILKTLQIHPEFREEINSILFANCETANPINFTSKFGARDKIKDYNADDFIAYVAEKIIDIYTAGISLYQRIRQEPKNEIFNNLFGEYYWPAKELIDEFNKETINIVIYFKSHPEKLLQACSIVTKARFIDRKLIEGQDIITLIDTSASENYKVGESSTHQLKGKITTDIKEAKEDAKPFVSSKKNPNEIKQQIVKDKEQQSGVENLQVRRNTVNKCVESLIYGSQLIDADNEFAIDGLYATQRKGRRPNQEDAVLIMTHPKNPEFKLMVVSDGMGGLNDGEYASLETVRRLSQWFLSVPADAFYYPTELQAEFNKRIKEISKQIYYEKNYQNEKNLSCGATMVGALITNSETIVSSVGDSRAYTLQGKNLQLVTSDESQAWFKYQIDNRKPTAQEIDDDRFLTYSNVITRCIGDEDLEYIQSYRLPNISYDRLLLFSDGVTDLITQERLAVLSSGHDLSTTTKYIVEEALTFDAIRKQGEDEYHRSRIAQGKDNATAAMYARR